jgi:hypothetical protein
VDLLLEYTKNGATFSPLKVQKRHWSIAFRDLLYDILIALRTTFHSPLSALQRSFEILFSRMQV